MTSNLPMGGIALLVMTDGRDDLLRRTIDRAQQMLQGDITRQLIHTDNGHDHVDQLARAFPGWDILGGDRVGFGGAIRRAWDVIAREVVDVGFVFHLEDDFLINNITDLNDLAGLLIEQPHLAQVALRRQAWGHEIPHGGFMEMNPEWYTQCQSDNWTWIEHRAFWTTNPSLYRKQILEAGWPEEDRSEGLFGIKLKEHGLPWGTSGADVRFGFWGSFESSKEWVTHIGDVRVGHSY